MIPGHRGWKPASVHGGPVHQAGVFYIKHTCRNIIRLLSGGGGCLCVLVLSRVTSKGQCYDKHNKGPLSPRFPQPRFYTGP